MSKFKVGDIVGVVENPNFVEPASIKLSAEDLKRYFDYWMEESPLGIGIIVKLHYPSNILFYIVEPLPRRDSKKGMTHEFLEEELVLISEGQL